MPMVVFWVKYGRSRRPVRWWSLPSVRLAVRLAVMLLAALLPAGPAVGQGAQPEAATSPALTATDFDDLAQTLRDRQQRDALLRRIETLAELQKLTRSAPPSATGAASLPAAGPSVVDQWRVWFGLKAAGGWQAPAMAVDLPQLFAWLHRQATDPLRRGYWIEAAVEIVLALVLAALTEMGGGRLIGRMRRRPATSTATPSPVPADPAPVVRRLVLAALPVLLFGGGGVLALIGMGETAAARPLVAIWIGAVVSVRLISRLAAAALAGRPAPAWTVPVVDRGPEDAIPDDGGPGVAWWITRLARAGGYGWAAARSLWWLGLPDDGYLLLLRLVMLGFVVLGIVAVLDSREAVAAMIAGNARSPMSGRGGELVRAVRRHVAGIWHALAILYLLGAFGVFMFHDQGGGIVVLRGTVLTVLLFGAARLLLQAMERQLAVVIAQGGGPAALPQRHRAARRLIQVIAGSARLVVWAIACVGVLMAWGIDALDWLTGGPGALLLSTLVRSGFVLLAAILGWELATGAMTAYFAPANGRTPTGRAGGRLRTILSLLRTVLFITLIVMVTLTILSEFGLNIAPLLAGAGVIGVAVGFGSQSLVKDIITGLFILIEDSMAVGDQIDLGGGQEGTVESLSLRTVRLRDTLGGVHTVPFSEIKTVTNRSRDFGCHAVAFSFALDQDAEAVWRVLKDTAEAVRQQPEFGAAMIGPIELQGIDQGSTGNFIIRARIPTLAQRQGSIGCAFNRRALTALRERGFKMV